MKHSVLALLISSFLISKSQEKLGISNSNYSPTNSIYLNPSSSVDSKTYMQLNLAGVNAFYFSNIAYLPWLSVWRLKRHPGEIQLPKISSIKLKKFLYANVGIDGPAFVMSKRNYGAGIFVRARSVVDMRGIPYELTNSFLLKDPSSGIPKEDKINLKNIKASSMTWVEYGLNYGMIIKQEKRKLITLGANLKYITGINIFYANIKNMQGYYNDSIIQVDKIDGVLRYNTQAWGSGKGWGLDIGATYKKMLKPVDSYYPHSKLSNCDIIDYKYKLAVSLRDMGYIRFTKGAQKGDFNASGYFRKYGNATEDQVKTDLNLNFAPGNVLATLPTNLSVQFDWNLENHVYLNGTIVKSLLPHSLTGVQSPNLISLCPRFEFKQFELAMPLTFQKFLYPQLGFAFRLRSFSMGFDNLFPLLFMKPKTYGVGVYFNLAISLFRNQACKVKGRGIVDCPPNSLKKEKPSRKKSGRKFSKLKFWKKNKDF
jgi:hypothetical protein